MNGKSHFLMKFTKISKSDFINIDVKYTLIIQFKTSLVFKVK